MQVEVAYARPEKQTIVALEMNVGATVEEAIAQSKLLERFPEIRIAENKVGIFGQIVGLATQLHDGDRVEIYRPLQIDPRKARMQRVRRS